MNKTELTDSIALYGCDLDKWPESLSHAVQNDPQLQENFQMLSAEEALFEQHLCSRSFEPESDDFAKRIIARSLNDSVAEQQLADSTNNSHIFRPAWIRPLLGMAATLIVGLAIGYSLPMVQEITDEESFDDYTALLYVQENLL